MATDINFYNDTPFRFNNVEDSCLLCDTRGFCQSANWSDTINVFFEPQTSDVVVANSTFTGGLTSWTAGAGWTAVGNKARLTTNTGVLSQVLAISANKRYKITFTLSSITGSDLFTIELGGLPYCLSDTYDGDCSGNPITPIAGTYTIFITTVNNTSLKFYSNSNGLTLDLDTIIVEEYNDSYTLGLYNPTTGGVLGEKPYNHRITTNAFLGYSYLWSDFGVTTDGCYQLILKANAASNEVDTITNTELNQRGISYNSIMNKIYVSNSDGVENSVSVYNAATNEFIKTIAVGATPQGSAFDPINNRIWVGNSTASTISVIDCVTDTVIQTLTCPSVGQPIGIAYDSLDKKMYICDFGGGTIDHANCATYVFGAPITGVGGNAFAICYDSFNNRVYTANAGDGTVTKVNCTTNVVIGVDIPVGSNPQSIVYDSLDHLIFVGDFSDNNVKVISTVSNTVITTITGFDAVQGLAYDPISNTIIALNYDANTASLISGLYRTITQTIAVGSQPFSVAFDSIDKKFFIGNDSGETISVIEADKSYLSECYDIKTDWGCTTKLLKWINDKPGFGIPYTAAKPAWKYNYMRVESDLRNARYKGDTQRYIDSGGNEKLYYGSTRKQKEFVVGMMPEYMHDALAIGLMHTDFYIDTDRYSFEDTDYTPEWSSAVPTVLAEAKVLVGKYTQDEKSVD